MKTYVPKLAEITRDWWVVDAKGLTLGRLATEVASRLRGKHKVSFTPFLDTGDHVVVVNASKVVLTGNKRAKRACVEEVAERTLRCLRNAVPAALPGVVFLSGGQTPVEATAHLNTMNALAGALPWKLSFSYSRALQQPALKAWNGDPANGEAARAALHHRAQLNSAASMGRYEENMEKASA